MDPSKGLDLNNENTAVRVVGKRKLPAGEAPGIEGKRRKLEWGSTGPEYCEHLLFTLVLAFVDTKTLLRCLALGRSWNLLIRCSGFRNLWAGQNETWVLLSSLQLRDCDLWIPGSSIVSPFKLLPSFHKVVASASGLVCVQRNFCDPLSDLFDEFPHLVVGNPITDEWVHLPLPHSEALTFPSFRMEVVGQSGEFRVAMSGAGAGSITCFVYDSTSGTWSKTELHFPASDAGAKHAFFDLSREVWVTDAITSSCIRTGLETRDDEVHALPHPCVHRSCFWKYRGERYFASPWYAPGLNTTFSGFGIWRVERATRKLEVVDAAWAREVAEEVVLRVQEDSEVLEISSNAVGRYVCFSSESYDHPAMPMVLYDLETHRWSSSFRPCEHPEHSSETDYSSPILYSKTDYSSAVLYSPSLLAPGRNQVRM